METRVHKQLIKPGSIGINGLKKSGIPKPSSSSTPSSKTVTQNSTVKTNLENMPPPKTAASRTAKTAASKSNFVTTRVAPKRPATTSSSVTNSKRARVVSTNSAAKPAAAASENVLGNRVKPNKWDLKGRLAYASEELLVYKKRLNEVTENYEEIKKKLNDLRENEQDYQLKAEKYKKECEQLLQQNETNKTKIVELENECVSLAEKLQIVEKALEKSTKNLKNSEEKQVAVKKELSEQTEKAEELEKIVKTQEKEIEDVTSDRDRLKALLHKLDQERRALHNTIQDLKGKIRVFCRVRPRTEKEENRKECTMHFVDESSIEVARAEDTLESCGKIRTTRQEFTFDKVFPPSATQEQVFEELELLVESALEGYNVCVFAYGQTGSGKTYTMEGNQSKETEGMIPRTVRHIFKEMKNFELLGWQYTVEASILEIYNEHIVDLLDSEQKTHEIRMVDNKTNDLYVTNLHVEQIDSPEKLHQCLQIAHKNRAVAATSANERSSRSHSVTRIRLIGKHVAKNEQCIGNLNLVDLAGSERLKNEEASRTVETKSINKSLSNLGNVILALLKKQDHIPYRNSKLTHILMPSLGGNSKTLMLLNISPLDDCFNETLNSLRFASTVNSCRISNVKRQKTVLHNSQ